MDDVEFKFYNFYNLEVSPNNTFLIEGVSDLYVMYNYLTNNNHCLSKDIIMIKNQIVENVYAPFSIVMNNIDIVSYKQTIARLRYCNQNFNKIIFTIDIDGVICKDLANILPYEVKLKKFIVNKSIINENFYTSVLVNDFLSHTKFKDICIPRGSMITYSYQDKTLYIEDVSKKFEALLLLQANL